jgi:hypothetical protein
MALSSIRVQLGDVSAARAHSDAAVAGLLASREAIERVVAETPDLWVTIFDAWTRWASGDAAGFERQVEATVALGVDQGLGSYPHAFALWSASLFAVLGHDPERALDYAETGVLAAESFGMLGGFMAATHGWAIGRTSDVDVAIAEIESAMELGALSGVRDFGHVFPAFLADTHLTAGRLDEAVLHARAGLEAADLTGERWYEPELHRLLGVALVDTDRPAAMISLHRAVELADKQGNRALGDRARESLAQLG